MSAAAIFFGGAFSMALGGAIWLVTGMQPKSGWDLLFVSVCWAVAGWHEHRRSSEAPTKGRAK